MHVWSVNSGPLWYFCQLPTALGVEPSRSHIAQLSKWSSHIEDKGESLALRPRITNHSTLISRSNVQNNSKPKFTKHSGRFRRGLPQWVKKKVRIILKKHGNRMAAKESITPYCNQSTGVLVTAPFISIDQSLERTWARSLTVKTDLKPMPLPQELKNSVHKASLAAKHVNSAQVLQQKITSGQKRYRAATLIALILSQVHVLIRPIHAQGAANGSSCNPWKRLLLRRRRDITKGCNIPWTVPENERNTHHHTGWD